LLRRLESKDYAAGELDGGALVYHATLSREELLNQRLKDAAVELCNGAATPLVLALVQGNRFSAQELERIQRIIDEAGKSRIGGPTAEVGDGWLIDKADGGSHTTT